MLGAKNIALIFGGKLSAIVESNFQRSIVRLQQNVRNDDFVLEFGMFARMPRILMRAGVPPWPTVEAAILHVSDVVGNKVVTQRIALVYGTPEFSGSGIDGQPDRVANAVSVDAHVGTIRTKLQNVSAIFFPGMGFRIVDVRGRADRDEHFLAIR